MSMAQEIGVNSGGKLMNPVENNFDLHVSKYTIFKYSCL